MARRTISRGFTIIELVIAIGFVSILVLAVSMLTIRVSDMYEKGATVRSINQVGREVVDVLRRDFAQANSDVVYSTTGSGDMQIYSLCLGDVSYIANKSTALQAREGTTNYTGLAMRNESSEPIRLARVVDRTEAYCGADRANFLRSVDSSAIDLLSSTSMRLAIHDMSVQRVAEGSGQSLYRVTVVLGTNTPDTVDDSGRCRVSSNNPEDAAADYNYCSVAELTTIMRTGGGL